MEGRREIRHGTSHQPPATSALKKGGMPCVARAWLESGLVASKFHSQSGECSNPPSLLCFQAVAMMTNAQCHFICRKAAIQSCSFGLPCGVSLLFFFSLLCRSHTVDGQYRSSRRKGQHSWPLHDPPPLPSSGMLQGLVPNCAANQRRPNR